jgi:hypothetical protein
MFIFLIRVKIHSGFWLLFFRVPDFTANQNYSRVYKYFFLEDSAKKTMLILTSQKKALHPSFCPIARLTNSKNKNLIQITLNIAAK